MFFASKENMARVKTMWCLWFLRMDIDVETYSEGQLAGGPVLPSADPSAGISMQLYTEKANAPAEVLNPDFGEQSSEPTGSFKPF